MSTQQEIVERHFKTASAEWGTRYGREPAKMSDLDLLLRRKSVHNLIRPILTEAKRPLHVLDVGCGSGHVWDGIPRDCVRLIGMDIVSEMVQTAANHNPEDHFLIADATLLPIADGSLDLITCLGVLEYLPNPTIALDSMARALRPSGHIIVSFPNKSGLFRRLSRCEIAIERWIENILRRRREKSASHINEPRYKHKQWSLNDAVNHLRESGFNALSARFNTFGLWGHLGRLRFSLFLSDWFSRHFRNCVFLGSHFACTMVIHGRKDGVGHESCNK